MLEVTGSMMIDNVVLLIGIVVGVFFVLAPFAMILKAILGNKRTADQDDDAANEVGPAEMERQADRLVGNPHYARYKTLFDYLDTSVQPQYKIDWLLLSMDMGHKIDEQFVRKSIEMGLPYFCEARSEFMMVADPKKPACRGSVQGMLDAAFLYNMPGGIHVHKEKCGYWVKRLMTLAQKGSREAQAALCCNSAEHVIKHEVVESFRRAYASELWKLAEAGDGAAQLAVGEFLCAYGSTERLDWLSKAAKQGMCDAWYHLGQAYEAMITFDPFGNSRDIPLSGEEAKPFMEGASECYLHGAEADNGLMASWCQYAIAGYYEDGGSILPRNMDLAAYWYQRAFDNGEYRAASKLESIIGVSPLDADEETEKTAQRNEGWSLTTAECIQFIAVMLALARKAAQDDDDIFLGTIILRYWDGKKPILS